MAGVSDALISRLREEASYYADEAELHYSDRVAPHGIGILCVLEDTAPDDPDVVLWTKRLFEVVSTGTHLRIETLVQIFQAGSDKPLGKSDIAGERFDHGFPLSSLEAMMDTRYFHTAIQKLLHEANREAETMTTFYSP